MARKNFLPTPSSTTNEWSWEWFSKIISGYTPKMLNLCDLIISFIEEIEEWKRSFIQCFQENIAEAEALGITTVNFETWLTIEDIKKRMPDLIKKDICTKILFIIECHRPPNFDEARRIRLESLIKEAENNSIKKIASQWKELKLKKVKSGLLWLEKWLICNNVCYSFGMLQEPNQIPFENLNSLFFTLEDNIKQAKKKHIKFFKKIWLSVEQVEERIKKDFKKNLISREIEYHLGHAKNWHRHNFETLLKLIKEAEWKWISVINDETWLTLKAISEMINTLHKWVVISNIDFLFEEITLRNNKAVINFLAIVVKEARKLGDVNVINEKTWLTLDEVEKLIPKFKNDLLSDEPKT